MPRARWPSCFKAVTTSWTHHRNRHQQRSGPVPGTGSEAHLGTAPPRARSRHQQSPPFKYLLAKFFCCYHPSDSLHEQNFTEDPESMQMGPLTLEDYIKTLEPYDPALHGWRGDEPWKLRTTMISCKFVAGCGKDVNDNGSGNGRVIMHHNQCLSNYCTDNILYI